MKRLSEIAIGQKVKIVNIDKGCNPQTKRRILEMGVTKGEIILIKKLAPLKDPIEVEVKGYSLSLRKNEADFIIIEEI